MRFFSPVSCTGQVPMLDESQLLLLGFFPFFLFFELI